MPDNESSNQQFRNLMIFAAVLVIGMGAAMFAVNRFSGPQANPRDDDGRQVDPANGSSQDKYERLGREYAAAGLPPIAPFHVDARTEGFLVGYLNEYRRRDGRGRGLPIGTPGPVGVPAKK